MPQVNFVAADGSITTCSAEVGDTVMQTAMANDIDGIVAECGGSMMCATCHCYVDEAWQDQTGPRADGEDDLLDCASSEVRPTSRLSCQIRLTPALDGLVVHLPDSQQ
ncbi:MAG: 2Fe-2S iron-sulfur cluster binding domain-containing protein [Thiothrix sp.]|nr:2Fe-2S iron-sulfur cluster binding domain-containing protein [Thiothrix sp.]HPQ94663.1 2Fe-2S iron-sulfur cluster-binding protein [Thiolinea sp.]